MRVASWLGVIACAGCFEKPAEPPSDSAGGSGVPLCHMWSPFNAGQSIDTANVVNTPGDQIGPWLSADAQELWYAQSVDLFHAQGGPGMWTSQISNLRIGNNFVSIGDPFIDKDDTLWFDGTFDGVAYGIFTAQRMVQSGDFTNPVPVQLNTNQAHEPNLSADGLRLYFREGADTSRQLMVATRSSTVEPFGTPQPLRAIDPGFGAPSVSADSLELFFDGFPTPNAPRIYDAALSSPDAVQSYNESTVDGVQTATDDDPNISPDGTTLVFTTNRQGTGGQDIWFAQRSCIIP